MSNKNSKITPFKKGNFWYFKWWDNGTRKTIPTKCTEESAAFAFIAKWQKNHGSFAEPKLSLIAAIAVFTDPDTNPAYKTKKLNGENYTLDHAKHRATHAKNLIGLINEFTPIGNIDIRCLTHKHCKKIVEIILEAYGNTSKAKKHISAFKAIISWYHTEAQIETNPCIGIKSNNHPRKKQRDAISSKDISIILGMPEIWNDEEAYNYFRLLVLTGMRRSEAAVIDQSLQIAEKDGITYLCIDRAFKDDKWEEIGLPKWGKKRSIPLSAGATKILAELPKSGPCFPNITLYRIYKEFRRVRSILLASDIAWETPEAIAIMSPHVLRHSLNTNLIVAEEREILISEYLSWEHQDNKRVQRIYTHIKARHLIPIANAIDRIYSSNSPHSSKEAA